jgi:hypothetical protein
MSLGATTISSAPGYNKISFLKGAPVAGQSFTMFGQSLSGKNRNWHISEG